MAQKDNFKPPVGVARAAERALRWIADGKQGSGFTDVGRRRAAQLAARQPVSADTIKRMKSFFARHAVDKEASGFRLGEKGYPSAGRVAWDAWGGDAGRAWANAIAVRLERELEKHAQNEHDQLTHGNWANGGGDSTKIYQTANFEEAVARLAKGEMVELKDVQAVHTFVKDLHRYAIAAQKRGEQAPNLDLCKVSVPKTNLFCGKSLGIQRVDMPQLEGTPREGSEASKLPRSKSGNVNVGKQFTDYLERQNVEVRNRTVRASSLSASQGQLVGPKVAALMDKGTDALADERIFVSRDGYVIDGHHRWAALIGLDASDNQLGDVDIKVVEIDMPIAQVLKEANDFTRRVGILPQVAKALISYVGIAQTLKKEQERRYTLGPLYIPDRVDAHGEFTDADELQKAVWKYVRDGDRRIRLQHNRDVVAGEWVEVMTWPYEMTIEHQMADGSIQKAEYPANTVFMGVVWKDWAWNLVKQGKVRGYSIGGKAERVEVELED
jgi:hypothetical protein